MACVPETVANVPVRVAGVEDAEAVRGRRVEARGDELERAVERRGAGDVQPVVQRADAVDLGAERSAGALGVVAVDRQRAGRGPGGHGPAGVRHVGDDGSVATERAAGQLEGEGAERQRPAGRDEQAAADVAELLLAGRRRSSPRRCR